MKRIFFLIVFGLGLIGLSGCYTIPRHFADEEEIVYYTPIEQPYFPEPIIDYPPPLPTPPVYYPPANQPRDRQPEALKDSYDKRDPLQGGNHRGSDEIKTDPPVRTAEQKDRRQR